MFRMAGTTTILVSVTVAQLEVAVKTVQVQGRACDGSDTFPAKVFYPTNISRRYPVLSFAHGATGVASLSDPTYYNGTMLGVASAGYIIIGLADCPNDKENEWKEQVDSLAYLRSKEQSLKDIIDYNASTGIFGHSMGAHSTLISASDADAVRNNKIAAAISMHPGSRFHDTWEPKVATLYWTGERDLLLSTPSSVRTKYEQCPLSVDRGFALFNKEGHMAPVGADSNNEVEWVVAMMDCKIKEDMSACDKVFGQGQNSMCSRSDIFGECETHRAEVVV